MRNAIDKFIEELIDKDSCWNLQLQQFGKKNKRLKNDETL